MKLNLPYSRFQVSFYIYHGLGAYPDMHILIKLGRF